MTISENTLMNVEQILAAGKPMTGQQIAKAIKRDTATVYRALAALQKAGKASFVRYGRNKIFFPVKTKPAVQRKLSAAARAHIDEIQKKVKSLIQKNGPTPLVEIVRDLPFPRSSTYAAVAEMRRTGGVHVSDGGQLALEPLPTPVVPGPKPVEDTPTSDLPTPPGEFLGGLVRLLTEQALEAVLQPLVQKHPELLPVLAEAIQKD